MIYLGLTVGSLCLTYILGDKTGHNPLKEEISSNDIDKFFYSLNSKQSLTSFLDIQEIKEKKNLRGLMDNQDCEIYKNKILKLKEETTPVNLNMVFEIDFVVLHSALNLFFYIAIVVTLYFIYFYSGLILSVTYCDGCINLIYPCVPCFVCFLYIYSFLYLILIIVLFYHECWGSINNFLEFLDCSSVNEDLLETKYYDLIDIKEDITSCLLVLGLNYIILWILSYSTSKEKKNIKEYHEYYISITEVTNNKHNDSIN